MVWPLHHQFFPWKNAPKFSQVHWCGQTSTDPPFHLFSLQSERITPNWTCTAINLAHVLYASFTFVFEACGDRYCHWYSCCLHKRSNSRSWADECANNWSNFCHESQKQIRRVSDGSRGIFYNSISTRIQDVNMLYDLKSLLVRLQIEMYLCTGNNNVCIPRHKRAMLTRVRSPSQCYGRKKDPRGGLKTRKESLSNPSWCTS